MRPKKILAFSLILLSAFGALRAREAGGNALTLDQCIERALSGNPLLLSSLSRYASAQARIRQAAELGSPVLSFDSDLQPRPFDFKRSGESYLGVSQRLEFPGRRATRRGIAASEADAFAAEIDQLKLDLAFEVTQAFYGLLLAGEKIRFAEQDLDLALDFLAKVEARFKAGDTAEVEVLRARVEAAKAANSVRIAENEKRLAVAGLRFLLSADGRESLEVQGETKRPPLALDPEALVARAIAVRPETRRIRADEAAEALRLRQARMSLWPDFELGFARHTIAGEAKTWDFTLSIGIPFFFWQPRRGAVAEAEAEAQALRRDAEQLRNSIRREVEEAASNALSARDQLDRLEESVLAQAQEVYDAFLYRYEKGEIGGIELIDARRSLMEVRRSYADALLNYHVTLAALERSVGVRLEGNPNAK